MTALENQITATLKSLAVPDFERASIPRCPKCGAQMRELKKYRICDSEKKPGIWWCVDCNDRPPNPMPMLTQR